MKTLIQIILFSFTWQIAHAQTDEIWYTANHEMIEGIKEARDHGVWIYAFNGPGGNDGSVLKKMSRNGVELLNIDFTNKLIVNDFYEYEDGKLFLGLNTLDSEIKSLSTALSIIIDENGNKIKEHLYLPQPVTTFNNKLSQGIIRNIIPVDETNPETDVILLGYASIGWDDPINPASEPFLGSMVGIERVDHLGNRLWTKRLTELYNWGLPNMIKLKDGNMLVTTNAGIYPNSPDSTIGEDGSVMLKMDMNGEIIWQNNTLIKLDSDYVSTRPEKPIELENGNIIAPLAISGGLGSSIWYSGILNVDKNGITKGHYFIGDTTRQCGNTEIAYLDTNKLIFSTTYNLTQGPGQDHLDVTYHVYTIDTLGSTINEWHSTDKAWSTRATKVPQNKNGFYSSPTNWYTDSRTKILKFTDSLTAYVDGVDTFTYNTTQNDNLDGLFIDLDYYDYLDSLKSIGLEEIPIQDLSIYPNPADFESKIQMPDPFNRGTITLYTIQGKRLYSATWLREHGHFNIPVSKLENGTYIIKLTTDSQEKWSGKLEVVK
ncbi:MAG: T9SS type A sorting domain-containing protein [Flavobacteriales bacterium]